MSNKGVQFLHSACQGGGSPPYLPVSYATVPQAAVPATLLKGKSGMKMNERKC